MVLSHVKGQFNLIISNETVKKGVNWAGKALHSPEQRLILGATALATQPFIDLNNKDVDEETRKISAARTIAKIIAGTTVGVLVRYAGIWAAKRYSQFEKIFADADKKIIAKIIPDKKRGIFTPVFAGKTIFPISDKEFTQRITRHRKAMLDSMQDSSTNLEAMLVFVNIIQESQELIGSLRHMIRGVVKFQDGE